MEKCEDVHYTLGINNLYKLIKETIERILGTATEIDRFQFVQIFVNTRTEMKVEPAFICMNLKKLTKIKQRNEHIRCISHFEYFKEIHISE